MPDTPVFTFFLLEEAGKSKQERQTQLNLVFKRGIRERIYWDVGSTQKRKANEKNIKFESDTDEGKGHEIRKSRHQEERNIIPLHSLSVKSSALKASVGLRERSAKSHQWDHSGQRHHHFICRH